MLTVDVTLVLLWADFVDQIIRVGGDFCLWANADSSPRAGTEWLWRRALLVTWDMIKVFVDAIYDVLDMLDSGVDGPVIISDLDKVGWRTLIQNILPPVLMGVGNSDVSIKQGLHVMGSATVICELDKRVSPQLARASLDNRYGRGDEGCSDSRH